MLPVTFKPELGGWSNKKQDSSKKKKKNEIHTHNYVKCTQSDTCTKIVTSSTVWFSSKFEKHNLALKIQNIPNMETFYCNIRFGSLTYDK